MGESRRIGEYQLEDIIGKGAAGSVYRGINLRTGGVVAIKQIRKEGFSSYDEIEAARMEIDMLRDLNHRNIVKYIGYEQTEDELDIILEYCEGGSLQNILRKFSKFPENLVGVYVAQILDGLSYLHSNAILHRDIKPGNILLLKEGIVKLADFGVARFQNGLHTVVGSPYWIAPEVLQQKGATTASDIWSLGCTIVQMVDGKAPYQDLQPMAALYRIGLDEHPPFPHNISPQLRDFLSRCLVNVPSARATADELRGHEWIRMCLGEQQREGQSQGNYERDIREITQWNQVLQNASPRDIKRFNVNPNHKHSYSTSTSASNTYNNPNLSYGSSRTRDDITGAISGVSSMGISNSNDSTTRRMVSSIAAYEEDSGDDWDNAFENLDALQAKPHMRAGLAYPQSIAAPTSPSPGTIKHSPSNTTDAFDEEHAHIAAPVVERAFSDPIGGHSSVASQLRLHSGPSSPMLQARRHGSGGMAVEFEDGHNSASSNEIVYADHTEYTDGSRVPNSSALYASAAEFRRDSVSNTQSKRPSLGLRQDIVHSSSTQLVSSSGSLSGQRDVGHLSLETQNVSSDQLPNMTYQQQQQQQQQQQYYHSQQLQHNQRHYPQQQQIEQQKQKPASLFRSRAQESRDIVPPGFPSRASEERLRRETEIRWVQDIVKILAELRVSVREDMTIRYCQKLIVLLREGRGVFSANQDWRVRSIVDAIRIHQNNPNVLKHLVMLVNRLCYMATKYSSTFCLHGLIPIILPILQHQHQAQVQAQAQQSLRSIVELQAETIGFIGRLCRTEEAAPIHVLLAAGGITALCEAASPLVELDVAVAAAQLSRVLTALTSLIVNKAMPAELSAADIGELLAQSHITSLLCKVFSKYGEACHMPLSGQSSATGSDTGHANNQTPDDRVYHGVCDVLVVVGRLFNEIVRRIDTLQDSLCDSDIVAAIFSHVYRYPRKAVVFVIHGVRYLSKNPMSLDVLDKAGIFAVSVSLIRSPSSQAYREYVMTTVLRLSSSSLERQSRMVAQYPHLVLAAMEYAQLKEAPTLSKCGRLIILGLSNGGAQCCRMLKEVGAFELIVKLISRERWCNMAIRALLEWTREVPADIVPSLTNERSTEGWSELARPLLSLSTSSTTLDMFAATFHSLVRLYVPQFPRACMGTGEATDDCLWVTLIDRYLKCSHLDISEPPASQGSNETAHLNSGMSARPEVVSASHMNATTRLTFLNLLLLLQPYLRASTADTRRRISHYYKEMLYSSNVDAALPVRKASLELSILLKQM